MRTRILLTLMLAAIGAAAAPTLNAQEALNGVWHVVEVSGTDQNGEWAIENVQPSQYMFMDGYYSIAEVRGEERRPHIPEGATRADLTPEQAAAIWLPYVSNSGTYEIEGSTLTTRPRVALNPSFMEGGSAVWQFERRGDQLHLMSDGPDGQAHLVLERVRR